MIKIGKADLLGVMSGIMCLLHCIATPFMFLAYGSILSNDSVLVPAWWELMDVFFLLVSFIAVYKTTKWSVNDSLKFSFWLSWIALLIIVLNEKFYWFALAEWAIYIPGLVLVVLHLYNINTVHIRLKNTA